VSNAEPSEQSTRGPARRGPGLEQPPGFHSRLGIDSDRFARAAFIWPAIAVVLVLSIFPLITSLYLSLARLQFVRGGIDIDFTGFANYAALFFGSQREHVLGRMRPPSGVGWVVLAAGVAFLGRWLYSSIRSHDRAIASKIGRTFVAVLGGALLWLTVMTVFGEGGRPGTLTVTIIYVVVGVALQYGLGLGLAVLATQPLPGRRFFRVVFLLPMMITPVGVAYMFRMLTDTSKGPFAPIWAAFGLQDFSWVNDPWGARIAIILGDTWQWTPFMFIVLLAALEAQDVEQVEAAIVDGAGRWQVFRYIALPGIIPVSLTVVLIRLIEGFKIIDLPNVLTRGGPGTATESLTLQAYLDWRTLNLGRSAAIAYTLLFVVTVVSLSYVNRFRHRVGGAT
jgi:multiple sugar transport system permease protein